MEGNYSQAGDAGAMGGMFMMLLFFGIYIYAAFAQFKIAQKLNHDNAWFAWIPILNIVQMIQMAHKPMLWFVGMLVPGLSIVLFVIVWIEIAKATGKPPFVGFLMLLPGINFIALGMMAWGDSGGSAPKPPSQHQVPQQPQSVG